MNEKAQKSITFCSKCKAKVAVVHFANREEGGCGGLGGCGDLAGICPGDRGRGGPIGAAGRGGAAGY